ncbi:MAG TPA: VOC family protein [Rhizomicrobium sp.]|nr:VOC family protein [Rhizomicrobium sp.]
MISHTHLGITDFERALAFYAAVMKPLGHVLKFSDAQKPWAAWKPAAAERPLFVIGRPHDGNTAAPGNGPMIALLAPDRKAVDECHAAAMTQGGVCEGAPGLRPQYDPNYYGAYFRDPDGNKLCVCCHEAESRS